MTTPMTDFLAQEPVIQPPAVVASPIRLNIAIVSDAAPGRNGVGTFYQDLLEHLQPHVRRIGIFSPQVDGDKWQAGLVLPLPGDKTQKLCMPNPFSLRRQLAAMAPDLVLIATPGVYGLFGAFLAHRMAVPAVAGFHTSFEQLTELYWSGSTAGKVVFGYFKVSNSYLFKRCPLVVANSRDMTARASALGARKTELVGTLIAREFIDHAIEPYRGELRRVLFAGRLAPEKNLEAIITAARAMPHLQFTVAGDGPQRARMSAIAAKLPNLSCLGWLDRARLRQQIDAHDILVLPSHFESFGTIALEAMVRQRLVAVSDGCGIAQWRELADGLVHMGPRCLVDVLRQLEALGARQRKARAQLAQTLTYALNQKHLGQWLELLSRVVKSGC